MARVVVATVFFFIQNIFLLPGKIKEKNLPAPENTR